MQKKPNWLGHRQRLRDRAEAIGLENLRPHEVIELILFYAVPRADMSPVARKLIEAFGSVGGVLQASREALLAVPGVTPRMAEWLLATRELVEAYRPIGNGEKPRMFRYRDVTAFLGPLWQSVTPPECWMLYTDYDDRLITYTVVCPSLAWSSAACVRAIVREAVAAHARHAILVAFVGTLSLEIEDAELAEVARFARTLHSVEVELLDCLRVGESGFYSLNLAGKMANIAEETDQFELHERYAREDRDREGGVPENK